ncbi:Tetratricopeptide-like helical domain [Lasallia pustulata]|uniref:Tetratricopeptide-like helical domain n=1 Tax=Lasallia pustulata TaxID=136370 RepID=A0A1W5CZV8_9LECA|nr:Tetratricopeptide-like helical domain [Lasallia pustulata]
MFLRSCPRVLRSGALRSYTRKEQRLETLPAHTLRPIIQPWPRPRHSTTAAAAKKVFKENPFLVSLASFFILCGMGGLFYVNYVYNTYIIGAFKMYPEPVAIKLRRALFYTNQDLQPNQAVKYYRQALEVADQLGMDPFSNEILGVKFQLASLMEKIKQYEKAIDILEIVQSDCLKWIELFGDKEGNQGKRTRVLGKTVSTSVKLGDLYAILHEEETAQARLVWAVETALKEQRRRETEGVKEGEGEWMSNEGIGGALESLAHNYEEKNQHYLAAPLFLQALAMIPQPTCHSVVLMNNLSISLAQQNPPPTPSEPPQSRSAHISFARAWAEKSLAIAATIEPPLRTEECDTGCAAATHNLGEFAEMDGDVAEARRRYEEARGLSGAIGFEEGVRNAEAGLKRLKGRDE